MLGALTVPVQIERATPNRALQSNRKIKRAPMSRETGTASGRHRSVIWSCRTQEKSPAAEQVAIAKFLQTGVRTVCWDIFSEKWMPKNLKISKFLKQQAY